MEGRERIIAQILPKVDNISVTQISDLHRVMKENFRMTLINGIKHSQWQHFSPLSQVRLLRKETRLKNILGIFFFFIHLFFHSFFHSFCFCFSHECWNGKQLQWLTVAMATKRPMKSQTKQSDADNMFFYGKWRMGWRKKMTDLQGGRTYKFVTGFRTGMLTLFLKCTIFRPDGKKKKL